MNESEEEEEQRDHSILSNIVEVISGAKQSATTEFDRFCENIGWKPKTRPVLVRNKRDKTKVQAGESVHGRIVPDGSRRKIGKDMEIQTDDISQQKEFETLKRRPSTRNMDGLNEDHRPTKIIKQAHFVSISRRGESVRPVQFPREDTMTPVQSPIKNILQQPTTNKGSGSSGSETGYYNTAPSTFVNNYGDSMDLEPREKILTGSKSVKRLTSELEKVFSAQKMPTFKKPKTEHNLPLREEHHSSPNIGQKSLHHLSPNTEQEPAREWTADVKPKLTPHIEPESAPNVEMSENSIESDMDEEIESAPSEAPPQAPPQAPPLPPLLPSTRIQIPQEDNEDIDKLGREEQRMRLLEKKLNDIHCQTNNRIKFSYQTNEYTENSFSH
ncbi:hypothetical protein G6F56_010552 [Rhizopus delemar]|nr:hypothetical protein G6F56_010552 [Rhizopus delemar]